MYQPTHETGVALNVTTSAQGTIGNGGPATLLGVLFSSNATANTISIFSQTAASATGAFVVANLTGAVNTFVRVPAYSPLGFAYRVPNDAVNVTLFWNPAD